MNRVLVKSKQIFVLSVFILVFFGFWQARTTFADEPVNVYYSVGQNTADHKTGSPTITISSGVATFSVPQTATNMGVGDKITYGTVGVVYISGKQSTSVWNVITATGGTPTATTTAVVDSVAHAFASLNAAVGDPHGAETLLGTADLTSGPGYILNIPCYYDTGADVVNPIYLRNFTTSVVDYIHIYTPTSTTTEVNQSQRHDGKWKNDAFRLEGSLHLLSLSVDHLVIEGFQTKSTVVTSAGVHSIGIGTLTAGNNKVQISNNIIRGVYTSGATGSGIRYTSANDNVYIYNNIIYGFNGDSTSAAVYTYGTTYAYNNTLYGNGRGLGRDTGTFIAKNNIAYNNLLGGDYTGTFSALSTNNLSKDATAPAFGTYYRSKTLTFTSTTTDSEDFHLVSGDTDALNKGTDLSTDPDGFLSFTTDIEGNSRFYGSAWDLGADEYHTSDITDPTISSIATSTDATSATITWMTDEFATSTINYGLTDSYGLASTSATYITSHSVTLNGLSISATYHFQISTTDVSGNTATSTDDTFIVSDNTPPVRSTDDPSGTLDAGTTSTILSLTTDENATCKYSTTADTAYADMTNTFNTTGTTGHSTTVSVSDGHGYHYYVRCQDSIPNANTDDFEITFRVTDSGTIYADTCSYTDVNTSVGLAESGEAVFIPACAETTWDTGIVITKAIVLQGAGMGNTNIKGNLTYSNTLGNANFALFTYHPSTPDTTNRFRITGMSIDGDNKSQIVLLYNPSSTIENIRVDNVAFTSGSSYRSIYVVGTIFGVIDNNSFANYGVSFYGSGTDQWDNISRNFGDEKQLYFEDNMLVDAGHGAGAGGRYASRYNSYTFSNTTNIMEFHGNQPAGNVGADSGGNLSTMIVEIYGNNWDLGSGGAGNLVDQRGGKNMIFMNKLTNNINSAMYAREEYADSLWPNCSYVQHVTDSYSWANMSTSQGLIENQISGENCCADPAEDWQSDYAYGGDITCKKWNNDSNGYCWKSYPGADPSTPVSPYDSGGSEPNWSGTNIRYTLRDGNINWLNMGDSSPIIEGTDIWMQKSGTFDGTGVTGGGVGCGTLGSRPSTCTTGVGYWVTNQSCSDLTDMVGVNPTTPISGTLYKCTSTDTWTSYYTPYVYPHPLTATSTMSTDEVDIGAGARVFGTAKFYNVGTASGNTADLSITPASGDLDNWLDISISTWSNTTTHQKTWTETSTNMGSISTVHVIGDLETNTQYTVKVDDVLGTDITGDNCTSGICTSDENGQITFTYSGGYSDHTFDVEEYTTVLILSSNEADIGDAKIKEGGKSLNENKKLYLKKDKIKLKGQDLILANGTVKIYKNGKKYATVGVDSDGKWSKKLSFGHNRNYILKIKFYDRLNILKDTKKYEVKVDTEKPSFVNLLPSFMNITRNERIQFTATDEETDIRYYKVKLLDNKWHIFKSWRKQNQDFYNIPLSVFNGEYILKIRAYDKAGNYAEEETKLNIKDERQTELTEVLGTAEDKTGQVSQVKNSVQEISNEKDTEVNSQSSNIIENQDQKKDSIFRWWNPFSWF